MTRFVALLAAVGLMAATSGCGVMATHGPVKAHLFTSTTSTISDVDNGVQALKPGVSQATGILFFATGDASVGAAMDEGGITKVHHVDAEVFSVLGLYATHKTIVYGE